MIPEDNDAGFGTERPEILILLDSKDRHCGNGAWSTLLTQGPIFIKSELGVSVEALDATLLLTVGMGVSQCLEERGRTVPMEIDHANKESNGIKSCRCVRSG
jgi:hypothetical protein